MNVGLNTVVEFLHKNGYPEVESNPNTRLSDEQYALLVKEFGKNMPDAEIKREASHIHNKKSTAAVVKEEQPQEIKTEVPEEFRPKIVMKGHINLEPEKKDEIIPEAVSASASVDKDPEPVVQQEEKVVPAVEKGLLECMDKGPLAGCKVVNVKAVLYDGSYHEVDSNEMAFKIAASLAFKKGISEAKPCLLEPIMKLEIEVPDEYMGDVMGDMNKRRGKILGMEPQAGGGQKLVAEAPQAELFDYAIVLRSMTQARGSFTMEFVRYEEVPAHLAEKIIAAHKAEEESQNK